MSDRPRVVIDCDPGHDDAVALVVAAHLCDLVGVTTVGGNAPLADVTANALLTCQVFGLDVEVHAGSARPMVAPPRHAPEVHGVSGFSGSSLPEPQRRPASAAAVEYLIETIRSEEGLWLIPTGPLTNVALALRLAPDLASRLAGISFMGGSAGFGNHTATAEFNIIVDPEAAAIVLDSGARLHMAGLDLTHQFPIDDGLVADVRALAGPTGDGGMTNPGAAMVGDLMDDYLDRLATITGRRWGALHDPCAVLAVARPDLISSTDRHVVVELNGTHTRGMTVVDQRPRSRSTAAANVAHGHHLDAEAARAVILDAIAVIGSR